MPRESSSVDPSPLSPQAIGEILLCTPFLEAIPDAIVAVEKDGTIVQVNSQTEAMFGYKRGELV